MEYARERLGVSGEEGALLRAHAIFVTEVAERAEPELIGSKQATWLDRLETEHDNARAALDWALERREGEIALRLSAALWRFWSGRGYLSEGRMWLARALAGAETAPLPVRVAALTAAGSLAEDQNDYAAAERWHTAALGAWTTLGDDGGRARALDSLGNVARDRGDYQRAEELGDQALAIARRAGDRWGIARGLGNLGSVAYFRGDYDRAEALWTQCLPLLRSDGDHRTEAVVLNNLGALSLQQGNPAQAATLHDEALVIRRRLGDRIGVAASLYNLGEVSRLGGDLDRAVDLFEEALALFREIGDSRRSGQILANLGRVAHERGDVDTATSLLRDGIARLWAAGDRFTLAEALEMLAPVRRVGVPAEQSVRLFASAARLRQSLGAARDETEGAAFDGALAGLRTELGDAAFDLAWEEGEAMGIERAVAEALDGEKGQG